MTNQKTPSVEIKVGSKIVRIPVSHEARANFCNQFVRDIPTPNQKRRYKTLMMLMGFAYQAARTRAQ